MIYSKLKLLFLQKSWRRWLERFRQFEEAMGVSELELLEGRVRCLEGQVSELRAHGKTP
jgi:hypothetical protein